MKVHAVVFGGTYGNQSTAVKLGCEIEAQNMKTWFSHPDDPQSKIHVIFDICHMLKLVRNLLGDTKELQVHQNGCVKRIQWKYIEALNNVQENLGLSLANKLRKKYLLFFRNKMKSKFGCTNTEFFSCNSY